MAKNHYQDLQTTADILSIEIRSEHTRRLCLIPLRIQSRYSGLMEDGHVYLIMKERLKNKSGQRAFNEAFTSVERTTTSALQCDHGGFIFERASLQGTRMNLVDGYSYVKVLPKPSFRWRFVGSRASNSRTSIDTSFFRFSSDNFLFEVAHQALLWSRR